MEKVSYLKLVTVEEAISLIGQVPQVRETEEVSLDKALHRVLAEDLFSPEDLPHFFRSTMDGYAVRARDTFGASPTMPGLLEVVGEVKMGEEVTTILQPNKCMAISTGGMLPKGADAVLMIEHTQVLDEGLVEVMRPVSVGDNVIAAGEDVKKGELIFKAGKRLRAQDLGLLAALGITSVKVKKKLRVGVISTGDEVVDPDTFPPLGKIRDVNRFTLTALVGSLGYIPSYLGRARDQFQELKGLVEQGLREQDILLISGGSSVGLRDLTVKVLSSFEGYELLCHGVMISPGKPTIISRIGEKLVFGLPGHVASAFVVGLILVRPAMRYISGMDWEEAKGYFSITAKVTRNTESQPGREDYVRVRIFRKEGSYFAEPEFGKSGLIITLVRGDGLMKIPLNAEGVYQGEEVEVIPIAPLLGDV